MISVGRLQLRPWQPTDEDVVLAACQDAEIQRWTTVPSPYSHSDARAWVTTLAPAEWEAGTGTPFAVVDAATGEVLASVGLHLIKGDRCEVGYWCAPWARGRSVTTEAVTAICQWGFAERGMRRIEWVAAVGNWASRAVAQKCGFRVEGVTRQGMHQRGGHLDCWTGALLTTDDVIDRRPLPPPPTLTDGVVTLRPWAVADVADTVLACNNPELARFRSVPLPYTEEHAEHWIEHIAMQGWAEGGGAEFAVTDAATGALIGGSGLKLRQRALGIAEVSYWTAPWSLRQGVASRAARLCADWGLETLAIQRVELVADVANIASQLVAERAGFTREGIARSARRSRDGSPRDFVQFSRVHADLPGATGS